MNQEKLLTAVYSHYAIGGLYLILGILFTTRQLAFYDTWTIFAYGILMIIFGVIIQVLKSRIAAGIELVLFLGLFVWIPFYSAIVVFGVIAVLLSLMMLIFTVLYHISAGRAKNISFHRETKDTTPDATVTEEKTRIADIADTEADDDTEADKEPDEEELSAEYAEYDPDDFEISLYQKDTPGSDEDIKITVSPYGVTISEYSDTSFGDNEAQSYVLDEVNTSRFLDSLKASKSARVAAVERRFSGPDAMRLFKDYCKENEIEFVKY